MPDNALLVAGAAVAQASSPTALLAQRIGRHQRPRFATSLAALVELLTTQDQRATDALDGSFHPQVARASVGRAR